jgi:hypothetical protein
LKHALFELGIKVQAMGMGSLHYRKSMKSRPRHEIFYALPRSAVESRSEEALIIKFASDRELFGRAYRKVQPSYFHDMPRKSGVFVSPLVRTTDIVTHALRPGDIDLLVVPYEGDELVLDRVLAIEVKAVRARFTQQGKSPNEFGFSQATALLDLGFPYVAVAHLIISDVSPLESWRQMMMAEVLEHDEIKIIGPEMIDPMPNNLTDRVYGRLIKLCTHPSIGLISAYVWSHLLGSAYRKGHAIVMPNGRPAVLNPKTKLSTLETVAAYYEENSKWFLDNPRHDPSFSP